MINVDYMSPFYEVKINGQITQVVSYDIRTSKNDPCDICTLLIPNEAQIKKDMDVEITLGYRENWRWKVFSGYIEEVLAEDYKLKILAKDEMVKLANTSITQAFKEVSPQEVIRYGLNASGIKDYSLTETYFSKRNINAHNISVQELILQVNRSWGLKFPFYFNTDKKFFWKEPEQYTGDIPVFEYGKNIIDIKYITGGIIITSVLVPFISHSMNIKVLNSGQTITYLINKVRWFTNTKGFPRTEIYIEE